MEAFFIALIVIGCVMMGVVFPVCMWLGFRTVADGDAASTAAADDNGFGGADCGGCGGGGCEE